MPWLPLPALLALGCASPPLPEVERDADDPVAADVPAEWSVADLEAAVATVAALPPVGPQEVHDAYVEAMSHGDAVCPGSTTQLLGADLRGCTADSGWFYAGVSTWVENAAPPSWMISGDFAIVDDAGQRFIGGGAVNAGVVTGPDGEPAGATADLRGEWGWPGHDDWLGTGASTWMAESAGSMGDSVWMELDGGLTYGGVSFWFDALRRDPSACDGMTGALRVRDPSGVWFTLDYGDTCATCAALTYDDAPMGTACPEVGAWMDLLAGHLVEG